MESNAAAKAELAAFEAVFWTLPLYPDAALLERAAALYEAERRPEAAGLLRALARLRRLGPADGPDPGEALRRRLEALEGDAAASVAAMRDAFATAAAPIGEEWALYRAAVACEAAASVDEAFLLAGMVLQVDPVAPSALLPARIVLRRLVAGGAWDAAATLLRLWQGTGLAEPDAAAAVAARGHAWPAPAPLAMRSVLAAEHRPAVPVALFGARPAPWLDELRAPGTRPAVLVAELVEAELLIAGHGVAVRAEDGAMLHALGVGEPAGLVEARLERAGGGERRTVDLAVLIADRFPLPNLCHFLLDQASRLALYAQAGIDPAQAVVVGPPLTRPFQREIARRMGAARYVGTGGAGIVRAGRLAVLSCCRHLRHPAHLGSPALLHSVRGAFGVAAEAPCGRRRLLVARDDVPGRQLVNQAAVEALLAPAGFTRVVPGRLTVAEQAALFAEASHIVAVHGAGLANMAFCGHGTRVLELFHPQYGTGSYAALAPPLGLDYAAAVGEDASGAAPEADHLASDLRADLSAVGAWLEA